LVAFAQPQGFFPARDISMSDTFDLEMVSYTNKIHPDEEARTIKAALNKAECTLHLLNTRFKAKGRRALVGEIRRYKVALAACKKLPTELLQSIFRHIVQLQCIV
jgi:hypothetical protein